MTDRNKATKRQEMVKDLKDWLSFRCPKCPMDDEEAVRPAKAKYDYAGTLGVSSETVRRWLLELTSEEGPLYIDEEGNLRWSNSELCEEHQELRAAHRRALLEAPPAERTSVVDSTHTQRVEATA